MNAKALAALVLVLLAAAAYFFYVEHSAGAPTAQTPTVHTTTPAPQASSDNTLPANVGAAGVSDPSAAPGTPEECAKCEAYSGGQKAQCLVALNCQ